MKLEVTCKTYIDVPVSNPDYWNSDTIQEYKEDLYAEMSNTAMEQIWGKTMSSISEDFQIINVKPYEEGIDEYNKALSDWEEHYNNRPEELKADIKYGKKQHIILLKNFIHHLVIKLFYQYIVMNWKTLEKIFKQC